MILYRNRYWDYNGSYIMILEVNIKKKILYYKVKKMYYIHNTIS